MITTNLTGDKVTIVTIFDKHEKFIKLQYDSIKKHITCEYEYIVFNNASNDQQRITNRNICENLGVQCIDIHVNYGGGPSNIAGEALNETFKYLTDKLVFKIDSDMFFINKINLVNLFEEGELIYIPNFSKDREIMWSGVFGINLKQVKDSLDFKPAVIPQTDTFGQSILLVNNPNYRKKRFELFNLQDIVDGVYTTAYNNDCVVKLTETEVLSVERDGYIQNDILVRLPYKYKEINTLCEKSDFPTPYNLDIITLNNIDVIFHFKSSNWCPWYTDSYVKNKIAALIKLLNNEKQ
jgi:hypothetical protein